jgi:two-component system chemotaxis response regulator CheB
LLVVQHITRGFTASLINWLRSSCAIDVKTAEHGEQVIDACAYFAPDDFHLGVSSSGTLKLTREPPIGGFRPSANALFSSVAAVYGSQAVAVILTGMGDDGVDGLRAIRRAGGWIIGQDEATSVVYGMPGAAAAAGVLDVVSPLDEISLRILSASSR